MPLNPTDAVFNELRSLARVGQIENGAGNKLNHANADKAAASHPARRTDIHGLDERSPTPHGRAPYISPNKRACAPAVINAKHSGCGRRPTRRPRQ